MLAAINAARNAVAAGGSKDWADYIHYADPDFVLKTGAPRNSE